MESKQEGIKRAIADTQLAEKCRECRYYPTSITARNRKYPSYMDWPCDLCANFKRRKSSFEPINRPKGAGQKELER